MSTWSPHATNGCVIKGCPEPGWHQIPGYAEPIGTLTVCVCDQHYALVAPKLREGDFSIDLDFGDVT